MVCEGYRIFYLGYFFFFNDTATTEIYTLSLHDALPILAQFAHDAADVVARGQEEYLIPLLHEGDRKSTRLNSSHSQISYAVFCLKKKQVRLQKLGLDQRRIIARGALTTRLMAHRPDLHV